jgi:RNA polymerase sigma factor (sigma-70 family)
MPSIGMQRGVGCGDSAFHLERAAVSWATARRRVVPRSSRGRDDGRRMAPDPEQLARRLARRSDAELLALTPSVPDAFDVFYVRHSQAIVSYLWRHTGSQDVALDLTSETFAVALELVARYDPARGDARGWLFGIAKITMLASYRKQSAERSARLRLGVTVAGYSDDAWDDAEARIDAALPGLIEGLDRLPRAERRAVVARILDELDYAEIATREQATEAAIRQRVKRGLSRLRAQVGRDGR